MECSLCNPPEVIALIPVAFRYRQAGVIVLFALSGCSSKWEVRSDFARQTICRANIGVTIIPAGLGGQRDLDFRQSNPGAVVSVLVEAIKEQQKEIDELKQAKTELASLKAKMAQLEVAVQQLVTTQKNDGESLAGSEE